MGVMTKHLHGDLLETLESVLEFLDNQVDVIDGDYGEPRPNVAMSLHSELDRAVERFKQHLKAQTQHAAVEATDERKIERIVRVLKAAKPAVSIKMDHRALAAGILYAIQEQA